jgi:hypothetical protein
MRMGCKPELCRNFGIHLALKSIPALGFTQARFNQSN